MLIGYITQGEWPLVYLELIAQKVNLELEESDRVAPRSNWKKTDP